MRKLLLATVAILVLLPGLGQAQETHFGKNKVRYKDFDWKYIETKHFYIHFYEDAYPTAKFAATVLESAYVEISDELGYVLQRDDRVPVFIYNSHNDFQQTNIISSLIPEGVGGFTEALKNRIVIPFTGSYEDFRHVLHHELTHAIIYDMLYSNSLSSLLSRQRLFNLPLWFAEGYAEYSSRYGWDYWADMVVRDATINGYLRPPEYLTGYLAYPEGQAMVKYIADTYGEDKLGEIIRKGRVYLTMNRALKEAIGIDQEKFWKDFSKEMKRHYWPEIAERKEPDEIGQQLTKATKDGSYFNEEPAYSPEGDRLAIFTDKSDYTEIVLISVTDGHQIRTLVKAERSGDLESLHSYVSGMSFSPDGRSLVFVAKSGGQDALWTVDVYHGNTHMLKKLPYYNVLSPAWSPDGKKIAFSALKDYKRDLFVYDVGTGGITQLTNDRYDDVDPSWMPDSKQLVFSSDHPHPETPSLKDEKHLYVLYPGAFMPGDFEYGYYNLFTIDIDNPVVKPLDVGPGQNKSPKVSPDGNKVAFISNRSGIDNIYIADLKSNKNFAVTDILSGIRSLSWSPNGDKIAYSAFNKGAFDIFILKELVPVGNHGELEPTAFVKGEYNLLKKTHGVRTLASHRRDTTAVDTSAAVADTTTAAVPAAVTDTALAALDTTGAAAAAADTSVIAPADSQGVAKPAATGTTATADSTSSDTLATGSPEADTTHPGMATKTGMYNGQYVFVSDKKKDALDSVLEDVSDDTTTVAPSKLKEPPVFDSVPPLLPSGEYKVKKYKPKLTADYIGGGVAYDTFFGLRGQTVFLFSDYLGNHQIYVATNLVNTIDQSFVQVYYFNNQHRTSFGVGLFHTKNYYFETRPNFNDPRYLTDYLFSDRFYGGQFLVSRPFSMFSRIDFNLSQYIIDREYLDISDPRPNRSSKVSTADLSYVTDNVIWGLTGPLNGRRAKVTLSAGINLFDANDISFQAAEFDYRKYWHLKNLYSVALRFTGGASFGATPKQYFLGGTTNWIGNRTLDAKVYDVENLYFADVVTPLRGVPYYELSGDRYALMNFEFRFPLIDYFAMHFPLPIAIARVQGALFTDMGAAWVNNNFKIGTTEGGHSRLQDVHTGFGFGMRANLGFVLLRYDIAWSTNFYRVSSRPSQYVSFGADF